MHRKLSLAVHLCLAQSLVWTNTESQHFWKSQRDKYLTRRPHESLMTNPIHVIANEVFKQHEQNTFIWWTVHLSSGKHTWRRYASASALPSILSATWSPQEEHMDSVMIADLGSEAVDLGCLALILWPFLSHYSETHRCLFFMLSVDPCAPSVSNSSDIKLKLLFCLQNVRLKHARPCSPICLISL